MSEGTSKIRARRAQVERSRVEREKSEEESLRRSMEIAREAASLAVDKLHERVRPNITLEELVNHGGTLSNILRRLTGRSQKVWEYYRGSGLAGYTYFGLRQELAGWLLPKAIVYHYGVNDDGKRSMNSLYTPAILTIDNRIWVNYSEAIGAQDTYGAIPGIERDRKGVKKRGGLVNGEHFRRQMHGDAFTASVNSLIQKSGGQD